MGRDFFAHPAELVARRCLGKILVHGRTAGRIVETEAYLGASDRAAHAWRGLTPRTRVLFGPPGHAYVYWIYGMHYCLNFVCEPEGSPGCVLIRALEPLCGLSLMRRRRAGIRRAEDLANGPGKLTQALAIGARLNAVDLTLGPLSVRRWRSEAELHAEVTPRIGIRHNAAWPLRFVIPGSPFASRPPRRAAT